MRLQDHELAGEPGRSRPLHSLARPFRRMPARGPIGGFAQGDRGSPGFRLTHCVLTGLFFPAEKGAPSAAGALLVKTPLSSL